MAPPQTHMNIPPPVPGSGSNPGSPNETPGTPTSTTTSMSTLSTTAIKDGHRGHTHAFQVFPGQRGHHHHPSANSLEAERADRISRLAGLERISTQRRPAAQANTFDSPLTTPTHTNHAQHAVAPAYFDANGQPTAVTKMSTVGSASATGSVGARTTTEGDNSNTEVDDGSSSVDTEDFRNMEVDSNSGAVPMDEDVLSDDGNASLVGFGEGANSTLSGPTYQRRPLPPNVAGSGIWGLERSGSGLSEAAMLRAQQLREAGGETPISLSALAERRDARMLDGVSVEGAGHVGAADHDAFVDTTTRGPISTQPNNAGQPHPNNLGSTSREAAERIMRERLGTGEGHASNAAAVVGSPKGSEKPGRFPFEDKK